MWWRAEPAHIGHTETVNSLSSFFHWITLHAHQSSPLPLWQTIVLAAVFTAATLGSAWTLTQLPATIVHELGHAYVARLTGRTVDGIKLQMDTSGVTHTTGKPHGLGYALTLLAGYSAPPLVGAACTWAALNGWSGAALMVLTLLLSVALGLSRNLLALVAITVTAALLVMILWHADAQLTTAVVQIIGVYLGVAGVRGVISLLTAHRNGDAHGSDATQLRAITYLPTTLWLSVFTTIACAAAAWQIITILDL